MTANLTAGTEGGPAEASFLSRIASEGRPTWTGFAINSGVGTVSLTNEFLTGDMGDSYLRALVFLGGILAVGTAAYLAAVYLAADARRAGHEELADYCAKRGMVSGSITGVIALAAVPLLTNDAETLTDRLQGRAAPLAVLAAVSGFGAIVLLYRKKYSLARIGATVAVGTVLLGWGVAQWPDFLIDHATLDDVTGARPTQIGLVIVFGLAAVTAVPALVWLLYLVNRRDQSLQN